MIHLADNSHSGFSGQTLPQDQQISPSNCLISQTANSSSVITNAILLMRELRHGDIKQCPQHLYTRAPAFNLHIVPLTGQHKQVLLPDGGGYTIIRR